MTEERQKLAVVTGGAGFVGSHLCERLVKEGYQVISLDNYFTGSKENHVDGVEYREGHTKDIEQHISETPDILYHLGEYSRVEQSILEPDIVQSLNTQGTQGVISFWKKKQPKLVYAGSSTKFGDKGEARHTSPYARTKAENSELIKSIGENEHLPYAITYFYNVYGPRERSGVYGTVIEHFKRMYISGAPCAIVSPGTQRRNFTNVRDIVEGLILVGENGAGDEFGLGHEKTFSIFEVAELFNFGTNVVMFPEREGNRMSSGLNTEKATALGWKAKHDLVEYINDFVATHPRGQERKKRILVFSTTMHPVTGLAEETLVNLAKSIPDVTFDVVTTKFTSQAKQTPKPAPNIVLHRVGFGTRLDKFLLPVFGVFTALSLKQKNKNQYLFVWSLMASYAALAGVFYKHITRTALLITLADQNVDDLPFIKKSFLALLLSKADQVYGTHSTQEASAMRILGKTLPRNTLGEGDAFANALRYAYADNIRQNQRM